MTAKNAKTAKATVKSVQDESEALTARLSEGAREFVKRSTSTAKERADGMYDASKRYNGDLEDLLVRAAKGYSNVLANIADAAYANANHTLATAEKVAEAKSLSDAMQIQMDFVREYTSNNVENVRSAYDYVRDVVTTNGEQLRDTTSKLWNNEKAA